MKLNEIDKSPVRQAYAWWNMHVPNHTMTYDNFTEFFSTAKMIKGVPVLEVMGTSIRFEWEGEWVNPPFQIIVNQITFANSDCRKLDLSFIYLESAIAFTSCKLGDLSRLVKFKNNIESIIDMYPDESMNVSGFLSLVSNEIEVDSIVYMGSKGPATFSYFIGSDSKLRFTVIYRGGEIHLNDVFDVQDWMIQNGFEGLI